MGGSLLVSISVTDFDGRFDDPARLEAERTAFLELLADYSPFADDESNAEVRGFLEERLAELDALVGPETERALADGLAAALERLPRLGLAGRPLQALVFYFDRSFGRLYLAGYGSVAPERLAAPPPCLHLEDRRAEPIFDELGPLVVPGWEEARSALYDAEVPESYDIADEAARLELLYVLSVYAALGRALAVGLKAEHLAGFALRWPLLAYVQEHDGGFCDLLQRLEALPVG